MRLFVPAGINHLQWNTYTEAGGLDLTCITFTSVGPVPLDVALGLPGTPITTGPPTAWTGCQLPDGTTFAAGAPVGFGPPPPSLEIPVTGPAILSWENWSQSDWHWLETRLDGTDWPATPLSDWPPTGQPIRWAVTIPAGQHQFRFSVSDWFNQLGEVNTIGGVTITPLAAAYAGWHPPYPYYPPGTIFPAPLPTVDYDQDGLTSLEEYAWQTDPYTRSLPPQPLTAIEGDHLTLCLPAHRPASDGVRVFFETSSDLTTWQRAAAELLPAPPPGQVKYRLTAPLSAASRLYVRTGVEFVE